LCASANAGFTTGTPWLPVPPSASAINVQIEQDDPDSLLNWYRTLIRLKKTIPAFARGANIMLDTDNTSVLSWLRQAPGMPQVVVSANFTAQPQTVDLETPGAGLKPERLRTLLKSPGVADPASPDPIELPPFGVYIGQVE
jgi:alpha-glucosidase